MAAEEHVRGTWICAAHGRSSAAWPSRPGNTTSGRIIPEKNSDITSVTALRPRSSCSQNIPIATR
ncbi:hypothetical protein ACFQY7_13580 [Actinomadura luteofluorescens]|uniref:hypothetical protein n=1 Tax=Actinomadura luteofluorescens TaxID=46163 RepID=UPI0036432AC0